MDWLCFRCRRKKRTNTEQANDSKAPAVKQPDNEQVGGNNMKVVPKDATLNDLVDSSAVQASSIRAKSFTFQELAVATNNFKNLIGEGGFGCVYKGRLEDGQVVAVKQLDRNGLQGNREFLVEVLMLSLLHHENLVNLIGYCADGDQRLLVYEFMPLGSLENHLYDFKKEPLDWTTRLKIAAGAAKGVEYLHDIAKPPVIYRDLKSSNILLGEDFYPKLSDFGLAKLGPVGDKSHVSTRVMGTYGYCAPEYAMTGQLTTKSDVYSFGVVLLELITGRRAIDQTRPPREHNLVAWARPLFKDRKNFSHMVDPRLKGRFPSKGVVQALAVSAMCVHEQAALRPSMAEAVTALDYLASQTWNPAPSTPVAVHKRDPEINTHQQSSLRQCTYSCVSSSKDGATQQLSRVESKDNVGLNKTGAGWQISRIESKDGIGSCKNVGKENTVDVHKDGVGHIVDKVAERLKNCD